MTSSVLNPTITRVGIGGNAVGQGECILEAQLGSCLGIALIWRQEGTFALAHCLLPIRRSAGDMRFSRYADTAPAYLLRRLKVPADRVGEIRAIIGGGADMYAGTSLRVGELNIKHGKAALRAVGVRVLGADVGLNTARRITIDGGKRRVCVIQLEDPQSPKVQTWSF